MQSVFFLQGRDDETGDGTDDVCDKLYRAYKYKWLQTTRSMAKYPYAASFKSPVLLSHEPNCVLIDVDELDEEDGSTASRRGAGSCGRAGPCSIKPENVRQRGASWAPLSGQSISRRSRVYKRRDELGRT